MGVSGWVSLASSSQKQWALSLTLTLFGTPERASGAPTVWCGLSHVWVEVLEKIDISDALGLVADQLHRIDARPTS
jgi:hypothetical protein